MAYVTFAFTRNLAGDRSNRHAIFGKKHNTGLKVGGRDWAPRLPTFWMD
uniref:Uncharacterized protein n=1 Tax=Rhizophora mucronata TaxID=61149 RepID=A0A2P2QXQ1_RHIMU